MIKKGILLLILAAGIIIIAGCETTNSLASRVAEGAKEDWQKLIEADAWMRKNLW